MENIELQFLERMASVDLSSMTSPYIPRTFTIWRAEAFARYEGDLLEFIKCIDYGYLPRYLKTISNAYHTAILNDPMLSELPKDEEGTSEVIRILTEWSIEVELAVDLVERAKLYKIYEIPYGYSDLFTEIKAEWRNPQANSSKIYKFFLKYLMLYLKVKNFI